MCGTGTGCFPSKYLYKLLQVTRDATLYAILHLGARHRIVPCLKEINVLDLNSRTRATSFFECQSRNALTMLAQYDPRRFRRVRAQIKTLVNVSLRSLAKYQRIGRICYVDLLQLPWDEKPKWSLAEYACTLVHEATHGLIESRSLPYHELTRMRIEKMCIVEAMRFATRLQDPEFDWQEHFRLELLASRSYFQKKNLHRKGVKP